VARSTDLAARHVLHLNLNTTDLGVGERFYGDVLGLDLRMKSGGDDGDWTFHGIKEPVSSEGWFFYDDRGPRVAPAVELVEWRRPATAGQSYGAWAHRGLTALHFTVPTIEGLAERVVTAGGAVVGPLGEAGLLVRDADGVHVELTAADTPVRLSAARIGCLDLEASMDWYSVLGFTPTDDPVEQQLSVGGERMRWRSVRVALPSAGVTFELTQWLDPVPEEPAESRLWHRGMVRTALSVDDLDEARQTLQMLGRPCPDEQGFDLPGTSIGRLRVLFLTDPDGLTVELVHRPPRHFARER
jgi:catechol 2,3-dioxygenase-like lactoylglutathione lyase family enzyme